MKNLIEDNRCPDRDSNRAHPECKSEALQPESAYSVWVSANEIYRIVLTDPHSQQVSNNICTIRHNGLGVLFLVNLDLLLTDDTANLKHTSLGIWGKAGTPSYKSSYVFLSDYNS
jgi:hypothetical protein